ncbi:short transient receptor potential channel 5-like [Oppia nitens]|uniref:short transient receptor potential channel 5-like n=1 Tax=Oppia nitens TaxID=1686743 RepID=UPI0023DB2361|nr:short transient receptor potential channel 5-like [Oppia nitens]
MADPKRYESNLMIEKLLNYAAVGDLKNVKTMIEDMKVDINSSRHNMTALSVCAAKSGSAEVIKYLIERGANIRDSFFHAIKAGNVDTVEVLLPILKAKNWEKLPTKESAVFPPYMTPIMLAAICGHRVLVELLMYRGHTIPLPHMPDCECDDCNVSSTSLATPSHRNLDIYRALCNPSYIGLNSEDPISKVFSLEREYRTIIENSHFSHQYYDISKQMENYITEVFDVTRDALEVNVLVQQKGVNPRPNAFIKYLVLQNAVDSNWVDFIASKRIESLRAYLWLGQNRVWFDSGFVGLTKKFFRSLRIIICQPMSSILFAVRYNKHITAQSRYLCRLFNESVFVSFLVYSINHNVILCEKSFGHYMFTALTIVWTVGNIVNITKKCAIFGLKKIWRFYGHVFELILTNILFIIVVLDILCLYKSSNDRINDNRRNQQEVNAYKNKVQTSDCIKFTYVLIKLLVTLIYIRIGILSTLRAYKGLGEDRIIRIILLSFCLIGILYPFISHSMASHYNLSSFGVNLPIFGSLDPIIVFIIINFLIGLGFEIFRGPEKIQDKSWCFHWTARLIHEIHGACELAVPFNLLEVFSVAYILFKRVGFKEKVQQKDVKQYHRIKDLVYSRYECTKYLESKPYSRVHFEFIVNDSQSHSKDTDNNNSDTTPPKTKPNSTNVSHKTKSS